MTRSANRVLCGGPALYRTSRVLPHRTDSAVLLRLSDSPQVYSLRCRTVAPLTGGHTVWCAQGFLRVRQQHEKVIQLVKMMLRGLGSSAHRCAAERCVASAALTATNARRRFALEYHRKQ